MAKILIVDDNTDILKIFSLVLREQGYECLTAECGESALLLVKQHDPDIIFLDIKLPKMNGIECLKKIKQHNEHALVIIITAFETVHTAVEAMKLGAYDYISKPFDNEKLKILIKNALEKRKLSHEVTRLREQLQEKYQLLKVVGTSPQIQNIFDLVKKVAPYNLTVLLQGESGTGKELIAKTIHHNSHRAHKPFVPIDCAVLPETLVESELFGYEKGAFTGADKQKPGKFELADGGSVFLDEICNISLTIQAKLLRVLQEKEIVRLGGRKTIKIDVRIIAATNADIEEEIKKGKFRKDLYYRIKEFSMYLPRLKDRGQDVKLLTKYFFTVFNKEFNKHIEKISPDVIKLFDRYSWPGNIRELRNVMRTAIVLCEDKTINQTHLPEELQTCSANGPVHLSSPLSETMCPIGEITVSYKELSRKAEKEYLDRLLKQVGGNKSQAARIMDIDYKTLCTKLKEYDIYSPHQIPV